MMSVPTNGPLASANGTVGTAPAPNAPPAALAAAPNAITLLKALRRCWVRAGIVAFVLAGLVAFATWSLVPTSMHTARTLIRVPPGVSKYVFPTTEPTPNLGDHQRTQVALVKSRLVLNAALKRPGVGDLAIVRSRPEAIEWLEKEIQADFSVAPEVLRIAISGDNPDELKTLIIALKDAYCSEILAKEGAERVRQLEMLGKEREIYAEKLRVKHDTQRMLEGKGGTKDINFRAMLESFNHFRLNSYEGELIRTESELSRSQIDLAQRQANLKSLATLVISEEDLQALLMREPQIVRAHDQVNAEMAQIPELLRVAVKGEAEPSVKRQRKMIADAEQKLAKLKTELGPQVAEAWRAAQRAAAADAVHQLEIKVEMLAANAKVLRAQVDDCRLTIQKMADTNIQIDGDRDATTRLEELTKRIGDEEARRRIEIGFNPDRFNVLEEATVMRAADDKKLIMTTAGAFIGTFAAVLLAFAFLEFRTRKIGTAEEVVHGLGMNLIGTIPDSRGGRSSATRAEAPGDANVPSTFAEAVDATRVMLLRAARTESVRAVMVTSAYGGEGKTSLSTHLAASLAQTGLRTLLIDGDLRNPIAHEVFGVEPAPGFCELLRGEVQADAVIRPTPVARLSMIPAGRWSSAVGRALAQDGVAGSIIRQFRDQFDFVIIDSSPVLPVVDPLLIGQIADGTILSVLRDVSRMASVYAAHQRLIAGGVRVLGAVVSGVRKEAYGTDYPYRQRVGA
jgi:polysaccharide biosynthesis transport protein